jgi:hypothetical protein
MRVRSVKAQPAGLPGVWGADTVSEEVGVDLDSAEVPVLSAGAAIGSSGFGWRVAARRTARRPGAGCFFVRAGFVVRAGLVVACGALFLAGAGRFALTGFRADCAAFSAVRNCLRTRRLALRAALSSALSVRTRALAAWTALRRVADSPLERFVFMNTCLPVRDSVKNTRPCGCR